MQKGHSSGLMKKEACSLQQLFKTDFEFTKYFTDAGFFYLRKTFCGCDTRVTFYLDG